jgi:bla regulator protein BlaR1
MKIAALNHRSNYKAIVPALFALVPLAVAQDVARTLPAKPLAFEVVSIRPSKPGSNWMIGWMTTPDGYRVTGQSIRSTIMIAYFPEGTAFWSKERLSGAPPWLDDLYDINAKISEDDLAKWQKQGTTLDKKPMLQQMLQAMLADRCHLVVRHVPGAEQPGEVLPEGVELADGGLVVPWRDGEARRMRFYGATMAEFARQLSQGHGHPVRDHTGLTGRYDFSVNWIDDSDSKVPAGFVPFDDSEPLSHWDIDALGLHLRPIKVPIDTLVIEHIEKPSEN